MDLDEDLDPASDLEKDLDPADAGANRSGESSRNNRVLQLQIPMDAPLPPPPLAGPRDDGRPKCSHDPKAMTLALSQDTASCCQDARRKAQGATSKN